MWILQAKPRDSYLKKYGTVRSPKQLAPSTVARLGRQVLQVLLGLHQHGFHHGALWSLLALRVWCTHNQGIGQSSRVGHIQDIPLLLLLL